jgi:hypothetical protein
MLDYAPVGFAGVGYATDGAGVTYSSALVALVAALRQGPEGVCPPAHVRLLPHTAFEPERVSGYCAV